MKAAVDGEQIIVLRYNFADIILPNRYMREIVANEIAVNGVWER
jgi:hypothetical protein